MNADYDGRLPKARMTNWASKSQGGIFRELDSTPAWMVLAYAVVAVLAPIICLRLNIYSYAGRVLLAGPGGASLALAVWALWGQRPVARLPAAFIAAAWIFIVYDVATATLTGHIASGDATWSLMPLSISWWAVVLLGVRWLTGIRMAIPAYEDILVPRWQFQIRDLFVWTGVIGFTLAAARLTLGPADMTQFVHNELFNSYYHACPLFLCLAAAPLAVAATFRWQWLPFAIAGAALASLLVPLFNPWVRSNPTSANYLAAVQAMAVEHISAAAYAVVLFCVLRCRGYRLTANHGQPATDSRAGGSR
jgi:hypothetical protein